jgi:hypothetical protein
LEDFVESFKNEGKKSFTGQTFVRGEVIEPDLVLEKY